MVLKWLEGFEVHGSKDALEDRYPTTSFGDSTQDPIVSGRFFGNALDGTDLSSGNRIVTPDLGNHATWVVGFAMQAKSIADDSVICELLDGDDTSDQLTLHLRRAGNPASYPDWFLEVKRGATSLGTTSTFTGSSSTWVYVEWKVTINTTTGAFEVRVNGTNELSGSSANTSNQGSGDADRVAFTLEYATIAGAALKVDDVYIADGAAGNITDFQGDVVIEGILPNAEGTTNDWTPSTGTDNSALVDDPTESDEDSTYVETSSNGDVDLYAYGNLAQITGSVLGLQVTSTVRIASAGSRNFRAKTRLSATNYNGDTIAVTDTLYDEVSQVWEDSPDTAAAWTVSEIDGAEFGIEAVA